MATINSIKNEVGKLFGGLPPIKQANLVFGALADLDKPRADAIESCVQWRDYRSLDSEYKQRLTRLTLLGSTYGLQHHMLKAATYQARIYRVVR